MNDTNKSGYYLSNGQAYFQNHILEGADPKTFKAIDDWHAKDQQHVFKYLSLLPKADPDSFKILSAPIGQLRNRFSSDKFQVFFELNPVKNADPKTFTILDEYHGKDKNAIYYLCEAISTQNNSIDIDTFIALGASFSKDKNHVYHAGKILQNASPNNFKVFQPDYWATFAKDDKQVYTESGQPLADADAANFKQLRSTPYGVDGNNVYRHSTKIVNAKAKSFRIINQDYTMDNNNVFYQGEIINGAKPSSFCVIIHPKIDFYSKDSNSIYKRNKRFPINGSIDKFEILDGEYCKDNLNAYYDGEAIDSADLNSFLFDIEHGLARDKQGLYFNGELQPEIDPETFGWITYELSSDKNGVYFMLDKINNLDPDSLEKINDNYVKDHNNVFYLNERYYQFEQVNGADAASFLPLQSPWACDKHTMFYYSEKLPFSDPKSFTPLMGAFAKDHKNVYYASKLLEDVDRESFECIDYWFAKDKYHIYKGDTLLKGSDSSSFVFLDNGYAKDNKQVYFDELIVEDAQPKQFVIISDFYAKDDNFIFSGSKKMAVDYQTARFIKDRYLADINQAFYIRNKIENVDIKSFAVISEKDSLCKDSHHVYFRDEIITNADPETFHLINDSQCRDKNLNYRMRQGYWQPYPL